MGAHLSERTSMRQRMVLAKGSLGVPLFIKFITMYFPYNLSLHIYNTHSYLEISGETYLKRTFNLYLTG